MAPKRSLPAPTVLLHYANNGYSYTDLADKYGVSRETVRDQLKRDCLKLGLSWPMKRTKQATKANRRDEIRAVLIQDILEEAYEQAKKDNHYLTVGVNLKQFRKAMRDDEFVPLYHRRPHGIMSECDFIEMSPEEAEDEGFKPCPVCIPLSQTEWASYLGLSQGTVSAILRGAREYIRISTAKDILVRLEEEVPDSLANFAPVVSRQINRPEIPDLNLEEILDEWAFFRKTCGWKAEKIAVKLGMKVDTLHKMLHLHKDDPRVGNLTWAFVDDNKIPLV